MKESIEIRVLGDVSSRKFVNKLVVGCCGTKYETVMNIKGSIRLLNDLTKNSISFSS